MIHKKHKRYVAHFDMLGFKSAVYRDHDEAWKALCGLQEAMARIPNLGIGIQGTERRIEQRLQAFIFSDSILIFSLADETEDLLSILVMCSNLFKDALHACIPLRGGIAFGDFYFNMDLSLYCGRPFVEAYQLGESAQWSGIVISDEVASRYHTLQGESFYGREQVVRWDVPLKSCRTETRWAYNWPTVFRRNLLKPPPITVSDYYQGFIHLFGPFADLPPDAQQKYGNTVAFLNEMLV